MAACQVNQIFLGEISSVQNYGAFVKIPGCPQQGLVHRSQVSSAHVDDVGEVLQRGERIWCKVISIGEDGKIALSMKLVNQGNGKDLDPNGVQLQLDEQRKKQMGGRQERKAIVLDAVYKTVCTKCKTAGHLAKDCFTTPDGKKYELLPEIDEEEAVPQPVNNLEAVDSESRSKEKKHKSKKSKKRKKSKTSKNNDSDSDDSDSSDEKTKKKKKKSKVKKSKKKRRRDNSSDSDSSDSSVSNYENKKHSKKCKHSRVRSSD
ncbi:hypothetical protein TSAR_014141 [Trichomalopsis sarcophagae]|uniref:S1 motif domain-containing protein n=1 Tax=Trichomalopsis sarcophagae TaxID=543379 RepID=A0A232F4G6_9HYME|nr:hypothetical protein TSAR_014141 [Trichomalopsis sarcophagae]